MGGCVVFPRRRTRRIFWSGASLIITHRLTQVWGAELSASWTGSCYDSPSACSAAGADTITGKGISCPNGYYQNKEPSCSLFTEVFSGMRCFPNTKNTYKYYSASKTFHSAGKFCDDMRMPKWGGGGSLPQPSDKSEVFTPLRSSPSTFGYTKEKPPHKVGSWLHDVRRDVSW